MANLDMTCPKCGADDRIDIQAAIWVRLTPDGTDAEASDSGGDHEFDPESPAHCCACGHAGHVADFQPDKAQP